MIGMDQGTTIFLRDDDVGLLTPGLTHFMSCFRDCGLPVSYQIIPARLDQQCAAFLRQQQAASPDLIEYGQHGLAHEMVISGRRLSWEFGRERDLATQEEVIAQGRAILKDRLGDSFPGRIFTPPRHRFNRDTVVAVERQGFDILSAANYVDPVRRAVYAAGRALRVGTLGNRGISYHGRTRPEARLQELSIAVAVDHGSPCARKVGDVLSEIARASRHTPVVGLMFHHEAWDSDQGQAFIASLAHSLTQLRNVRFALPGALVRPSVR